MGKLHKAYFKNSPFYQGLFSTHGAILSRIQAKAVASEHGLDLTADLDYPESQELFGTLELVQRLGY